MPDGTGYAHAMPRQSWKQPSKPSTILLHWTQYWEPQAILHVKRAQSALTIPEVHEVYETRVSTLLSAGVSWPVILARDLDSPLQSAEAFITGLKTAIENRDKTIAKKAKGRRRKLGLAEPRKDVLNAARD